MQTVRAERRDVGPFDRSTYATAQWDAPLRGELDLLDDATGETVVTVRRLALGVADRQAVRGATDVASATRTRVAGFSYASTTFGFRPRSPLRKRYACASCDLTRVLPASAEALHRLAGEAAVALEAAAPQVVARQLQLVDGIGADWKLPGGLWTSGIVNYTAALPYHRDGNNVPGSWSSMLVLRRSVDGGHLHLPEYGVWLACDDGDLISFQGSALWHAVTPLRPRRPDAYRVTTVFYAVANMAACLPPDQEIERAKVARTAAEHRIADALENP